MANGLAVLGVIRAARPTFRSAHDRVAFAVHSAFLAGGYSLAAAGPAAEKPVSESSSEEAEVGIEGWNELDGAYAFRYSGTEQPGLCKSLIVKCTVLGDLLMVDAAPSLDADSPANLEIKVKDYAKDTMSGNYGEQYSNLDGLVSRVNSSLISTLSPSPPATTSEAPKAPSSTDTAEREWEIREPRTSLLAEPPRSSGFELPGVPAYGGSDLLPGPGAGIFAPRRDVGIGGDTMLVGPQDPRWGRVGVGSPHPGIIGGPTPPGAPPGARFDPYGPPGVPGFEPSRFVRDPRRPPGGTHPDLEHFSPY